MCYGHKLVLSDIALSVLPGECLVLMGPVGSGKSSLLRALAGMVQQHASVKVWGLVTYQGDALGVRGYPALVSQNARMLTASILENLASHLPNRAGLTLPEQRERICDHLERSGLAHRCSQLAMAAVELPLADQRLLAIARQSIAAPALLCVDEPTAGLDDDDAQRVMNCLAAHRDLRSVLVVTHQQQLARMHADRIALLAGGHVQEIASAAAFFGAPKTQAARTFIGSGQCLVASPDADPETLDEQVLPPPVLPRAVREAVSAWAGPRGFVWLERGRLAGTPQPGVFDDLQQDLDALVRVGVTRLLTLLERPLPCEPELRARGIETAWEPIADMDAPEFLQCLRICRCIDAWLAQGETVAVHCRAGHGRTGTVLAAYRIWHGQPAIDAIDGVRLLEPKWIQSAAQVAFLNAFADWIQRLPGPAQADALSHCTGSPGATSNP